MASKQVLKNSFHSSPSTPVGKKLYQYATEIAIAKNPQLFFNLSRVHESGHIGLMDANEEERQDVISVIKEEMAKELVKLDVPQEFVDFIERLAVDGEIDEIYLILDQLLDSVDFSALDEAYSLDFSEEELEFTEEQRRTLSYEEDDHNGNTKVKVPVPQPTL